MKSPNRDLLVLLKNEKLNEKAIELEVKRLNKLLFNFESQETFCNSHELLDLNKFKIVKNRRDMVLASREKGEKPFVFLSNLN